MIIMQGGLLETTTANAETMTAGLSGNEYFVCIGGFMHVALKLGQHEEGDIVDDVESRDDLGIVATIQPGNGGI